MSKNGKIALAAATVWPFAYMIIFFASVFGMMLFFSSAGPDAAGQQEPPVKWFMALFALHFLTMLWVMGLMIFYIVDVFRNDRVEKDKKVLWAVVLFLGSILAMPVYWYLYIWRAPDSLPAADTSFGR